IRRAVEFRDAGPRRKCTIDDRAAIEVTWIRSIRSKPKLGTFEQERVGIVAGGVEARDYRAPAKVARSDTSLRFVNLPTAAGTAIRREEKVLVVGGNDGSRVMGRAVDDVEPFDLSKRTGLLRSCDDTEVVLRRRSTTRKIESQFI